MQSALLEVMQEHQVTIGRETFPVPEPFLVMATENPIESEGTYPLPEAQVDRFMMKVLVDYPSQPEEQAIVARALHDPDRPRPILTTEDLLRMRDQAPEGVRRPGDHRLRGTDRRRDPVAGHGRARRARTVRHLRGEPAGVDRARHRRPGAGVPARPRTTCCRTTCPSSRSTCCATASCCRTRPSRTTIDADTIINRVLGAVRAPEVVLQNR